MIFQFIYLKRAFFRPRQYQESSRHQTFFEHVQLPISKVLSHSQQKSYHKRKFYTTTRWIFDKLTKGSKKGRMKNFSANERPRRDFHFYSNCKWITLEKTSGLIKSLTEGFPFRLISIVDAFTCSDEALKGTLY